MRIRHAVVLLAIALVSASAVSDEPVLIALAVEPDLELEAPAPTLESAARANDFPTFDALYRANPDPAFRTLHEVWTYSMTERAGAFYGPEMYERLSREYPRYAEFIAGHRIVDRNGEAFYPASETRAFLLDHRTTAVATAERRLPAGRSAGTLPAVSPERAPAGSRRSVRQDGGAPPVKAAPPVKVPVPVPTTPVSTTPVSTTVEEQLLATATVTPAPVVAPAETATPIPAPAPVTPPKSTNRGLLLVIVGLIGVGLLALIVRAPREVIS